MIDSVSSLPANFVSNASSSRSSRAAKARRAPAIFASFLLLPVPWWQRRRSRCLFRTRCPYLPGTVHRRWLHNWHIDIPSPFLWRQSFSWSSNSIRSDTERDSSFLEEDLQWYRIQYVWFVHPMRELERILMKRKNRAFCTSVILAWRVPTRFDLETIQHRKVQLVAAGLRT